MKLRILNVVGRVTGSCYVMQHDEAGLLFLVDCGLVQGEGDSSDWNKGVFPFDPAKVDFVVLTHGHLDHCGMLPALYKRGFKGTVYTSRETAELARIVMRDAAHLGDVPYTEKDVARVHFHEPNGKGLFVGDHPVAQDLYLHFMRSSHLMGAISVQVAWQAATDEPGKTVQRRILFSGDQGVNQGDCEAQPLLRVSMRDRSDYVVTESTYGGRVRDPQEKDYEARLAALANTIRETVIEKGGTLLIPVFALGRCQDVLFDLQILAARDPDGLGHIPIVTAAPMGDKASRVYQAGLKRTAVMPNRSVKPVWRSRKCMSLLGLNEGDADDEAVFGNLLDELLGPPHGFEKDARREGHPSFIVKNWARRHRAWRPKGDDVPDLAGSIVVAGSGMCEGGHIVKLLPLLLPLPTTTVFFTGFQSRGTNGARLVELVDQAPSARRRLSDSLRWHGDDGEVHEFPLSQVEAAIRVGIGYSGHADQDGLLEWLFYEFDGQRRMAGRTVFLTHGDNTQRKSLKAAVALRAAVLGHDLVPEVLLPTPHDLWYDLDRGAWVTECEDDEIARLEARLAELRQRKEA